MNEEKNRVIYKHINGEMWCSIPCFPISKELNIKETTIRAIRKQQNHYKTTKNLTKGEW